MSFQVAAGNQHWSLSAQLLDRTKSTEEDWADLGRITATVGSPKEPMFPIENTPPEAVHHFQWFETPDGPVSLAGAIPNAVKDYGTETGREFVARAQGLLNPCARCGSTGVGGVSCKLCDKKYTHCRAHQSDSEQVMRGHILRVHPESVPGIVDQLIANKTELAAMRKRAEQNPELWTKLFAYIDERLTMIA